MQANVNDEAVCGCASNTSSSECLLAFFKLNSPKHAVQAVVKALVERHGHDTVSVCVCVGWGVGVGVCVRVSLIVCVCLLYTTRICNHHIVCMYGGRLC